MVFSRTSTYYLLSTSQGLPISKCCLSKNTNSLQFIPNWKNIARLVAFITDIYPIHEEFQFNNGSFTYYSKPILLKDDLLYFITLITDGNDVIHTKCIQFLCRYIGIILNILFQSSLEKCFEYLKQRTTKLIQSNTFTDTIHTDDDVGDDNNESNSTADSEITDLLLDVFPESIDFLGVFQEHFISGYIPILLSNHKEYFKAWFYPIINYPISKYFSDFNSQDDSSTAYDSNDELPSHSDSHLRCSLYTLTNNTVGSLLLSSSSLISLKNDKGIDANILKCLIQYNNYPNECSTKVIYVKNSNSDSHEETQDSSSNFRLIRMPALNIPKFTDTPIVANGNGVNNSYISSSNNDDNKFRDESINAEYIAIARVSNNVSSSVNKSIIAHII